MCSTGDAVNRLLIKHLSIFVGMSELEEWNERNRVQCDDSLPGYISMQMLSVPLEV